MSIIPEPPSPLALVQDDDPQFIHQAERKLVRKKRLSDVFSRPKPSSLQDDQALVASSSTPSLIETTPVSPRKRGTERINAQASTLPEVAQLTIKLDDTALVDEDLHTDRYEWAIVYENQRGMTVFSIPYYSSLSLLPTDPSPFTLPNASLKRSKQAPISLENYPLPDGNWRWVSRCWMIDMRADSGEVQHDGFEYNWMFRRTRWRAQVGAMSAGGWVRRRRWMRLMVRPAKVHACTPRLGLGVAGAAIDTTTTDSASPVTRSSSKATSDLAQKLHRLSLGSHFPPSLHTQGTDFSSSSGGGDWAQQIHPDEVWMGDCAGDWQRCRELMRRVGRDGRKLELWKLWLGFYHPDNKPSLGSEDEVVEGKGKAKEEGNRRLKQWTEDSGPLPSELAYMKSTERDYAAVAPKEYVVAVLREHGKHILSIFMFPESRVQFLKLVAHVGLLAELNVELGIGFEGSEIDFWSYVSGLENETGVEGIISSPTSRNFRMTKALSAPNLGASLSPPLSASLSRKGKGKLLEVPDDDP